MEKCKIKFPHPTKTEHAIEVHLHQTTWQHTSCEVPSFIARVELRTGQYCSCSIFFFFVSQKSPRANLPSPPQTNNPPTHLPTHPSTKTSTNSLTYPPTYWSLYQPTSLPITYLPTHLLTHPPKPLGARNLMQYFLWEEKLEPTHTISPTIHAFCHLA